LGPLFGELADGGGGEAPGVGDPPGVAGPRLANMALAQVFADVVGGVALIADQADVDPAQADPVGDRLDALGAAGDGPAASGPVAGVAAVGSAAERTFAGKVVPAFAQVGAEGQKVVVEPAPLGGLFDRVVLDAGTVSAAYLLDETGDPGRHVGAVLRVVDEGSDVGRQRDAEEAGEWVAPGGMVGECRLDKSAVELAQPAAAALTSPAAAPNPGHPDTDPGRTWVIGHIGQVDGPPAFGRPERRAGRSRRITDCGTRIPRGGHGVAEVLLRRRGAAGRTPAALGSLTPGGTQECGHPGERGRILNMLGQPLGASRFGDQAGNVGLAVVGHGRHLGAHACPDWQAMTP
jgi:hypothetical protein